MEFTFNGETDYILAVIAKKLGELSKPVRDYQAKIVYLPPDDTTATLRNNYAQFIIVYVNC